MSQAAREIKARAKKNESGPDYLGYYKHLVSELFSQNEEFLIPFLETDSSGSAFVKGEDTREHNRGRQSTTCSGSVPFLNGGSGELLNEFTKERLQANLNQSTICLNQEVDEILDQILAIFQIESDLRKKELLSFFQSAGDDDDNIEPLCGKKRKSSAVSDNLGSSGDNSSSESVRQAYRAIHALQGHDELCPSAVEKYSDEICSKLGEMEQGLEEYLNIVVSKCRQMTRDEKHNLALQIQKLPEQALDRVVEIIKFRNITAINRSENFIVNLEQQDNITLWRLYYYVETVVKANRT